MFWNKKPSDSSLPELPPLEPLKSPRMPRKEMGMNEEMNEEESEIHSLPSFSDSPSKKGFSQSAIKEAISIEENQEQDPEETISPEPYMKKSSPVMMEMSLSEIKKLPIPPLNTKIEEDFSSPPIQSANQSKTKDIFVKIDKFQSARKSLSSASEKVNEVESLLKKIRETRMREDQELTAWEKDLESVKTKIEEVSKNIFEKI